MSKSIFKLLFFLIVIAAISVGLKIKSNTSDDQEFKSVLEDLTQAKDTSLFFIGSSRVKNSVNPSLINAHFHNLSVYNLGISGAGFLSNCVMADYIIQQSGYNIVFIELSPLLEEVPKDFWSFSYHAEFNLFKSILWLTKEQSVRKQFLLLINVLNNYLFKFVYIYKETRESLGLKGQDTKKNLIGFTASDTNNLDGSISFLNRVEIDTCTSIKFSLANMNGMIENLNTHAKENRAKIIFFLPITYNKGVEKSIVFPLYNLLSDSVKLNYSEQFLLSMAKNEYMKDHYHLNNRGATAYSQLLIPEIERFLNPNDKAE